VRFIHKEVKSILLNGRCLKKYKQQKTKQNRTNPTIQCTNGILFSFHCLITFDSISVHLEYTITSKLKLYYYKQMKIILLLLRVSNLFHPRNLSLFYHSYKFTWPWRFGECCQVSLWIKETRLDMFKYNQNVGNHNFCIVIPPKFSSVCSDSSFSTISMYARRTCLRNILHYVQRIIAVNVTKRRQTEN